MHLHISKENGKIYVDYILNYNVACVDLTITKSDNK